MEKEVAVLKISKIEYLKDYLVHCRFNDGIEKTIDLSVLLSKPVFNILSDKSIFKKFTNKNYFIEWENYDLDLSADTLFHL